MSRPKLPLHLLAVVSLGSMTCGNTGLDEWTDDSGGPPFGGDTQIDDSGGWGAGGSDDSGAIDTGSGGDDSGGGGGGGGDTGGASGGGDGGGDGGGSSTGHAPQLSSLDAEGSVNGLEITFEVFDEDLDLAGGVMDLTLNGTVRHLMIPDDITVFAPGAVSRVTVNWPVSACDSETVSVSATISDITGLTSSERSDGTSVSGDGISVPEDGDDADTALELGTVNVPFTLCGALYGVGHNSAGDYVGDWDWVHFTPAGSGTWSLSLDWSASNADYDMYLVTDAGSVVASGNSESTTPPENINQSVSTATGYYLVILGWDGGVGSYNVSVR